VAQPPTPRATPAGKDGDGVRVVDKPASARRAGLLYKLLAFGLVAAGIGAFVGMDTGHAAADGPAAESPDVMPTANALPPPGGLRALPAGSRTPAPPETPIELPSRDPDDIAAYLRPGDPEPTAAEVIEALRHAGIRSGIAAFNPPGTSPPLQGLAVPADYVLPEGYVRHHQVTDGGEPIEPILMFSPDYAFQDADGRPITVPEDRVVPPALAPRGFPIRQVRIPGP
jgi:hypothetical protein